VVSGGGNVDGFVAHGWASVRDAFAANLATGRDLGASVAVYHQGHKVVDLSGGWFDARRTRAYAADTLQVVFSTGKAVLATAAAVCVERGWLDYDDRVSDHWPEFAAHGKDDATAAQLLSHQCGLICPDDPLTLAEILDWEIITSSLADTVPDWPIGSGHGYHALTFGWLAGELIRRVDPRRRSLRRFVADELARPLQIDLSVGLPRSAAGRLSPMVGDMVRFSDDPMVQAITDELMDPETRTSRAYTLRGAIEGERTLNRRDVQRAEVPAVNAVTDARSLARLMAATMRPLDGIRLLGGEVLERARHPVTPPGEKDLCLLIPTSYSMGYLTGDYYTSFAGPGSFGHTGAGGSVAFAQPERDLSFAYVMNQMSAGLAGYDRADNLIAATVDAADHA